MIQNVKKLRPQLQVKALRQIKHLRERHIPILESRTPENISTHISKVPQSRRSQHRIFDDVATISSQHIQCRLVIRPCRIDALLIPSDHVSKRVERERGWINEI